MRLASLLLVLCACQRAEPPPPAQQTYSRLHAFERPTLQAFSSDKQLLAYLDALSWVQRHGVESERAAQLPRRTPKPLDDSGWDVGAKPWPSARSRAHDTLPRLTRQRERVFLLRAHELVSFALRDEGLRLERRVSLDRHIVWDAIYSDERSVVLLGSCQDTHAVEVVRFDLDLKRQSSYRVFFRAHEVDGYLVRWQNGTLVFAVQHQPLFDDTRYTLPSFQGPDDATPRSLLPSAEIQQPLLHASELRLHTVIRCDVASCRASATFGPPTLWWTLEEDAAYLWLTAWRHESAESSVLLRMPNDLRSPGAVRVRATDGAATVRMLASKYALDVAVSQNRAAPLALFRVRRDLFSAATSSLPSDAYRSVGDLAPGKTRVDLALLDDSALWLARRPTELGHFEYGFSPNAQVVPLSDKAASVLALGHAQSWFLQVDRQTLISGSDSWHLHTSLVSLDDTRVLARDIVRDARRNYEYYSPLVALARHDDERWVAQVLFGQSDATLRVLRSTLDRAHEWTLPHGAERADPMGLEALALSEELTVLRLDATLFLVGTAQEARLLQTLAP